MPLSYFNFDVGYKSQGSLEDSFLKRGDIPKKSMLQIIKPSSSIVIVEDKSHPRSMCIVKSRRRHLDRIARLKA